MNRRLMLNKTAIACTLALLALSAVHSPSIANAATEVNVSTAAANGEPDLRIEDGTLILSLDEAVAISLQRNLSLLVERYRQEESQLALWRSEGIYDPNLTADMTAYSETSPTASNLDGAEVSINEGRSWNFGLGRLFGSGGQGQILWNNARRESNSTFATINPSYRTDFDLQFRQPLLKNFGKLATNYGIRIARTNLDISRENFEGQVTQVLQDIEDAYWDLVGARAQLAVAEESLELARQLHEQNRIRVDVGTLAPLEMVQSEAGVATREEEIIRARAAVGDSEDRLRQLLNLDTGAFWDAPIEPDTEPQMDPIQINLDQAIETALAERPEVRSKRLAQQNLNLDVDYFRNQERPQLDLALTYGYNGLGGDITERNIFTGEILSQAPGNYSDALKQISDRDFDGWSVALNFAYPLGNRQAKAARAIAEVASERGGAELRDLELTISTEVRRIARFVETAAQARASAEVSRVLAEKNLDAEQKRYENGMSTSFQVLEIQEDLSAARSREVNAVTGYRKALVQYFRAIGRLVEEAGVEIVNE